MRLFTGHGQLGGVALEYVMVTTFAAVVGLAALSFIGKLMKERLDQLAERSGSSSALEIPDVFGEDSPID